MLRQRCAAAIRTRLPSTPNGWTAHASTAGRLVAIPVGIREDGSPFTLGLLYQHVLVASQTGSGKALALDTPIPTPDGWTTMGALKVGDRVFDEHGQPVAVTRVSDVMTDRPCYEVEFACGEVIVTDADHQG